MGTVPTNRYYAIPCDTMRRHPRTRAVPRYPSRRQVMTMFFWSCFALGSGTLLFPSIFTDLLNPVMVTSLPILLYPIFDTDVTKEDSLSLPALYSAGITRIHYTHARLLAWALEGIYTAALCAYLPTFFVDGVDGTVSVSEVSLGCMWAVCITIDVRRMPLGITRGRHADQRGTAGGGGTWEAIVVCAGATRPNWPTRPDASAGTPRSGEPLVVASGPLWRYRNAHCAAHLDWLVCLCTERQPWVLRLGVPLRHREALCQAGPPPRHSRVRAG